MSENATTGLEKVPTWLLDGAVLETGKLLDPQGRWEIAWEPGGQLRLTKDGQEAATWPPLPQKKGGLLMEVARRERVKDRRGSGWLLVKLLSGSKKKVLLVLQAEVKQAKRLNGLPWRDIGAAQIVRLDMLQTLLAVSKRAGVPVMDWDEDDATNRLEDSTLYKLWEKIPGTDDTMRAAFAGGLLWVAVWLVLLFSGVFTAPNPPKTLTPDYTGYFEVCDGAAIAGKDTWTLTMSPTTKTLVFERVPFAVDWLFVGWIVIAGLFVLARIWETRHEKREIPTTIERGLGLLFVLVGLAFFGSGTRITLRPDAATEEATMYGFVMWSTRTALSPEHKPTVSFPNPDDTTRQILTLSIPKSGDQDADTGILLVESHDGDSRPLSVVKELVEGMLRR